MATDDQKKQSAAATQPDQAKPAPDRSESGGPKAESKPDKTAKTEPTDKADQVDTAEAGKAEKSDKSGKPAAKPKRRKLKLSGDHGRVYVQATFNNTVVSFTDASGNVIIWGSAGAAGFKGSRKSTPYAATLATQAAAEKAKQAGLKTADVFVRGVGSGRDAAVRALNASGLTISTLRDLTPVPHNGVRAKKPRRV